MLYHVNVPFKAEIIATCYIMIYLPFKVEIVATAVDSPPH